MGPASGTGRLGRSCTNRKMSLTEVSSAIAYASVRLAAGTDRSLATKTLDRHWLRLMSARRTHRWRAWPREYALG
jgi:hypothetical protein